MEQMDALDGEISNVEVLWVEWHFHGDSKFGGGVFSVLSKFVYNLHSSFCLRFDSIT